MAYLTNCCRYFQRTSKHTMCCQGTDVSVCLDRNGKTALPAMLPTVSSWSYGLLGSYLRKGRAIALMLRMLLATQTQLVAP